MREGMISYNRKKIHDRESKANETLYSKSYTSKRPTETTSYPWSPPPRPSAKEDEESNTTTRAGINGRYMNEEI
jgi:hypothetical protein